LQADWSEGEIIAGRYRILGPLGMGGMGTVFRAEHVELKRPYAVKFLSRDLLSNAEAVQRFRREAQLVSNLRHPNLVDVVDSGSLPDGQLYLVMELCEGTDLRTLIRERGPLSLTRARDIVRQVSAALEYAHAHGVIHRDLKSANIMVATPEGDGSPLSVKVLDFGISKSTDAQLQGLTLAGCVMGTPEYMSPEQATGKAVDGRSDLYSLGIVLYESLSGTVPFSGTPTEVLSAQLLNQPPPLGTARGDLPPEVCAAVMRVLEKDPEKRFSSAAAFAESFERACGSIGETLLLAPGASARTPRTAELASGISGAASRAVLTPVSASATQFGRAPSTTAKAALSIAVSAIVGMVVIAAVLWPRSDSIEGKAGAAAAPEPAPAAALGLPPVLPSAVPLPPAKPADASQLFAAQQFLKARQLLEGREDVGSICLRAEVNASAGDGERAVTDAERCIDLDPKRRRDLSLARAVVRGLGTSAAKRAYKLLVEEMPEAARAPLLGAANDRSAVVRRLALRAARKLGYGGDFDVVVKLLLDLREASGCKKRRELILELAKTGDRRALPDLEQEISRPKEEVRCYRDKVYAAVRKLRRSAHEPAQRQ
jgi:serine/threonine-protein kinase